MSNAVEDFLHALKRTINGDPYPAPSARRYAPVRYRIAKMRDPLQDAVLCHKYRVEARIGKGAMATVYKAVQQPIDRVVALKVLSREYSLVPINVKRFHREAKTLSSLKHRNILVIHDVANTDDGRPFLVMEYLDGLTLEELIEKRGPVPVARALPVFCQVCDGMSYAHRQGLIHRDLKPGNVMLVKDEDGSELVKLVDFGIVKQQGGAQSISQKLTMKGEIWGSPSYMSPEQCMGSDLDCRSDIYSMGLLMYEALSGVPAFAGGAPIGAIISKQLSQLPPSFKQVAPDLRIPETLEQIVYKTLQKKPEDRLSTMDELKAELEAFAKQLGIRMRTSMSMSAAVSTPMISSESAGNEQWRPDAAEPRQIGNVQVKPTLSDNDEHSIKKPGYTNVEALPCEAELNVETGAAAKKEAAAAMRASARQHSGSNAMGKSGRNINKALFAKSDGTKLMISIGFGMVLLALAGFAAIIIGHIGPFQKTTQTNGSNRNGHELVQHDPNIRRTEKSTALQEKKSQLQERRVHLATEKKAESGRKSESQITEKTDATDGWNHPSKLLKSKAEVGKQPQSDVQEMASRPAEDKPMRIQHRIQKIQNKINPSDSNDLDDEASLERIHLRKHPKDNTQKWLDVQQQAQ